MVARSLLNNFLSLNHVESHIIVRLWLARSFMLILNVKFKIQCTDLMDIGGFSYLQIFSIDRDPSSYFSLFSGSHRIP